MTEVRLELSREALEAIVRGEELVLDIAEENLRVFLACDQVTLEHFASAVQRAMLHLLPVGDSKH